MMDDEKGIFINLPGPSTSQGLETGTNLNGKSGTFDGAAASYSLDKQEWADGISRLVTEKLQSVLKNDVKHLERKKMAGIVMTRKGKTEVICVTTGSRSITSPYVSTRGNTLNDMHAPILARRCLVKFFYDQLRLYCRCSDSSIFELNRGVFELKEGIEFHLYISKAPCGDARMFHQPNAKMVDGRPPRKPKGKLQAKIAGGKSTISVKKYEYEQKWKEILQGKPMFTMSCSDKIAKWNVVGIQGAMLATIIKPIYLSSIILGCTYYKEHIDRAFFGRIQYAVMDIDSPYHFNTPEIYMTNQIETKYLGKGPKFAVNWIINSNRVEIIDTTTGKLEMNGISRISKRHLCKLHIMHHKFRWSSKVTRPKLSDMYYNVKQNAKNYQKTKKSLVEAFKNQKLGWWVSKPKEQDQFKMDRWFNATSTGN